MNNALQMIVQMMNGGGNPAQILGMMAQNNPQIAGIMNMLNGKSPNELKTMAENMCRERGTSLAQMAQNLGLRM